MYMIWNCCNLSNELMKFYMRKISSVLCHGDNNKCWSDGVMKWFSGGISIVIWNGFCVNYCNCDFDICKSVTVILSCHVCACPSGGV